jgi:hypothetical protein
MKAKEVDADVVRVLARVAGISIPDEDMDPLIGALRNHLSGMEVLEGLDLDESDPIVTFDPRWT